MKKIFWLLIITFLLPSFLECQTTYDDSKGVSSIIFRDKGRIQVNLTDANIKLGYRYIFPSKKKFGIGLEFSGKNANGFATLLDKDSFTPETKINLTCGWQYILSPPPGHPNKKAVKQGTKKCTVITDDWITIQIGYNKAKYELFSPNNSYDSQIEKKYFNGYSAKAYYNVIIAGEILAGISLGFEKQNNYDSLDKIEVTDRVKIYDNGEVQRITIKSYKLRTGDYKEGNHLLANFDIVWIPKFLMPQLAINLFGRYDSSKEEKFFTPGLGIYILKKDEPTVVHGGITFEYRKKKTQIGLVAGLKF